MMPTFRRTWTEPVSSDDRGVVYTFASHNPPFAFPIGTTTVTYRARDAAGNEGVCTFNVEVRGKFYASPELEQIGTNIGTKHIPVFEI